MADKKVKIEVENTGVSINMNEVIKRVLKYLVEGGAVAIASHLISSKKMSMEEAIMIGLTAAAVLATLDMLSPDIAGNTRKGIGFRTGLKMIGF